MLDVREEMNTKVSPLVFPYRPDWPVIRIFQSHSQADCMVYHVTESDGHDVAYRVYLDGRVTRNSDGWTIWETVGRIAKDLFS